MENKNHKTAIAAIERAGALLVFPMDNRKEPASLWSSFYPGSPMRWEWDEGGDDRVARLWQLRGELSTTRKVVYTKWFRGRATYFSRALFPALLRALNPRAGTPGTDLSQESRRILEILDGESPLSTKELKKMAGLKGRANEAAYARALKELWERMLIVAFGEVDDGAFPSLAVGSTRALFDDLWDEAFEMSPTKAHEKITHTLKPDNLFFRHYEKLRNALPQIAEAKTSVVEKKKARRAVPRVVNFGDF